MHPVILGASCTSQEAWLVSVIICIMKCDSIASILKTTKACSYVHPYSEKKLSTCLTFKHVVKSH